MKRQTVFLMCVLAASTAVGQTLEEAWQQAEAHSPLLSAQRWQQQAASADSAAARAAAGLQLQWLGEWQQRDRAPEAQASLAPLRDSLGALGSRLPAQINLPLDDDHGASWQAELRYPLYTAGKLDALLAAAVSGEALAQANTARARLMLRQDVADAFYAVLRSAAMLEVAQQQLAALRALKSDVEAMYQQGVVARADVLGAAVAVADAEQKQLAAAQACALSQAAFNRLLGVAFDAAAKPEAPALPGSPGEEASWRELAAARRPELAALRAAADSRRRLAEAARADSRPQLSAFARYQYSDNPLLVHSGAAALGLGMRWQLFDSGLSRARAASYDAQAEALGEQLQDAISLVALEVRRSYLQANEARQRQHLAEAALAQHAEHLRVQQQRYRNGLTNQTDVLLAQTRYADAQRALQHARYDYAQAYWQLRRAAADL